MFLMAENYDIAERKTIGFHLNARIGENFKTLIDQLCVRASRPMRRKLTQGEIVDALLFWFMRQTDDTQDRIIFNTMRSILEDRADSLTDIADEIRAAKSKGKRGGSRG